MKHISEQYEIIVGKSKDISITASNQYVNNSGKYVRFSIRATENTWRDITIPLKELESVSKQFNDVIKKILSDPDFTT